MTNLFKNIRASLAANTQSHINNMASAGVTTQAVKNFDFDAISEIKELPQEDCLGFGALTLTNDENTLGGAFMLIVSTYNDLGTLRLIDIMDYLFDTVQPGMKIPLLRYSDGTKLGDLIVETGSTVLPVEKTKTRPLQAINVRFKSSLTQSL